MFDTHCHLYHDLLIKHLDEIINKSKKGGVEYFLVPGVNYITSEEAIEISNNFRNMFSSVGIHPTEKIENENIDQLLSKIEELVNENRVVAVGEIGLDYYHKNNSEKVQKALFEKQLIIALKHEKSVIIHSRNSSNEVVNVLEKIGTNVFKRKLVFHCAEPEEIILNTCLKNNFYIGIDGDITFNKRKQDFIKKIPLKNIVIETDSPYLAPTFDEKKDKEKINYPYYLKFIVQKISEVKNISVEKTINQTTKNALLLFGIVKGYNK